MSSFVSNAAALKMRFWDKTLQSPDDFGGALLLPVRAFYQVTPGQAFAPQSETLPGPCRAMFADAPCTVVCTDLAGNTVSGLPLSQGRNDVMLQAVASVTPPSTNLFAGY